MVDECVTIDNTIGLVLFKDFGNVPVQDVYSHIFGLLVEIDALSIILMGGGI